MFACPLNTSGKTPNVSKRKNPNTNTKSAPWVYYDDQDDFVEISESSDDSPDDDDDDEWESGRRKRRSKRRAAPAPASATKPPKRTQNERVKKGSGDVLDNAGGADPGASKAESSKGKKTAVAGSSTRRRAGVAELGKLDLNVEFSNEVEEPAPGISEGHGAGNGVEDNIEGIGFFEGLDEFLSSLPILKG
jgi:hypothetical protein